MSAYNALQNIIYRAEQTTPTLTGNPFKNIGTSVITQDMIKERRFLVTWEGAGSPTDITSGAERVSPHQFTLSILYPSTSTPQDKLMKIMTSDQLDIIKTMEDSSLYLGISTTDTLTNCGILSRNIAQVQTKQQEDYWILEFRINILLLESFS